MEKNGIPVYNLYARRVALGLSAEEVARRVRVSLHAYYDYERGKMWPRRDKVVRLSLALRLPLAALLSDTPFAAP